MSARDIFDSRSTWRAVDRLCNAGAELERALSAPGEFPAIRRQDLESIADDVVVAMTLLHKILEAL
jgi:hypothetical protein